MKVKLTPTQVEQLAPYFDRVREADTEGELGMLVAQLWFDNTIGEYVMDPVFLRHEYAKLLEERGERYAIPENLSRPGCMGEHIQGDAGAVTRTDNGHES